MLSSLLVGVLSAVLLDVGSQSVTPTSPSADLSQATSTPKARAEGFALRLPGTTLCFGQPRDVRCDRYWPLTAPPSPTARQVAEGKKSWHFTVLDKTICFGEAPRGVSCTVRLDPAAATQTATRATNQSANDNSSQTTHKTAT